MKLSVNILSKIRNPFLNLDQTSELSDMDSASNQLSWLSWIISKFGIEIPDMHGYITEGF